ncbi:MAG: hypothetical protein J6W29_10055, partial [Neisseriaceae bacterium]|nr:hypothetical protein [Neisseriaceae bacterium]
MSLCFPCKNIFYLSGSLKRENYGITHSLGVGVMRRKYSRFVVSNNFDFGIPAPTHKRFGFSKKRERTPFLIVC